jgi:hypothetical protein
MASLTFGYFCNYFPKPNDFQGPACNFRRFHLKLSSICMCRIFKMNNFAAYTATKISSTCYQKRNCTASVPNFHIHVSVSDLYIPTMGLSILSFFLLFYSLSGLSMTYCTSRFLKFFLTQTIEKI